MNDKKNPYDEEFGILPIDEIRMLLLTHKLPRSRAVKKDNLIGINHIFKELNIRRDILFNIANHPERKVTIGPVLLRRLSRFLLRCACGMIERKDGQFIYHDKPARPMPIIRRVLVGGEGVKLTAGKQLQAPGNMPKFLSVFQQAPTLTVLERMKK